MKFEYDGMASKVSDEEAMNIIRQLLAQMDRSQVQEVQHECLKAIGED